MVPPPAAPTRWRIAPDRVLELDASRLIGILNVTPDSFFDGGRWPEPHAAVSQGVALAEVGADIVEVGGESTRPGAASIDPAEQIRRVLPVIDGLRERGVGAIAIDTTSSAVARAALDAGAMIVNDVSGGHDDPDLLPLVAERGAGVILMHRLRPPAEDRYSNQYETPPEYDDVVVDVRSALGALADTAMAAGVARDALVLDPGLGFGKTVEQNFQLIARTAELVALGFPVLNAASRKSFIGAAAGVGDPEDRLPGSVAITLACHRAGIRLFRVHDVAAHRQALAVAEAMERSAEEESGRYH